jgi:hypothetical protein
MEAYYLLQDIYFLLHNLLQDVFHFWKFSVMKCLRSKKMNKTGWTLLLKLHFHLDAAPPENRDCQMSASFNGRLLLAPARASSTTSESSTWVARTCAP